MAEIEFKDVSFTYPGCEHPALDHISFTINESEFVVVCGTSGSGKTTLLRHMKKNMIPYGKGFGDICYRGTDIESLSDRISVSKIGYVQQNPENQIVTDKVWHEMAFGLESLGVSNEEIRKKTAEMAEYFGISGWFRRNIWELSGGQKQLLNLASIMVMQPEVLILDEPTAQLDPIAATQFIDTIVKINRDFGTTIILSEHRLEEVFPSADKVIAMENGKIVAFDTPRNVGKVLTDISSPLFYGLPSAMKVYAELKSQMEETHDSQPGEGINNQPGEGINSPITVKEGRLWLDRVYKYQTEKAEAIKNETAKNQTEKIAVTEIELTKNQLNNQDIVQGETKDLQPIAIELKNIYFRYDKKSEDVLEGVSIAVKKGEIMAILGANGVGKTTMLKIMTGVKKPYSGKVCVNGKIIALPQNPQALFTEITVEDELAEAFFAKTLANSPTKTLASTKEEMIFEIEEMLAFMDLTKYRKTNPYDLSGGEQQKLAIAKVLLLKPQVLLLDEPTKGIDPYFKRTLAQILKKLTDQGVTIVMVSHDIEFCAQFATRCAMLFDGVIVSEGKTREFFGGNSFYTTAANRMSRHIFTNCVTCEQVIEACKSMNGSKNPDGEA